MPGIYLVCHVYTKVYTWYAKYIPSIYLVYTFHTPGCNLPTICHVFVKYMLRPQAARLCWSVLSLGYILIASIKKHDGANAQYFGSASEDSLS